MSGGRFAYEGLPSRVRFGPGRLAELGEEVEHLGARRVLLIAGRAQREHADRAAAGLGALLADRIDGVRPHVPLPVAEAARARAREAQGRLPGRPGRRLGGGSGQGGRAHPAPAHRGGPHHLRRLGDDARVGAERGRAQGHRPRPGRAAAQRDLRPRAVALASGRDERSQRHERDRPLRGGVLDRASQSADRRGRRGGHPHAVRRPALASWPSPMALEGRSEALAGAWLAGTRAGRGRAPRCTTRSATSSAAWGFPTPRCTRSSFPTSPPSTARRRPAALDRIARALGAADAVAGLRELAGEPRGPAQPGGRRTAPRARRGGGAAWRRSADPDAPSRGRRGGPRHRGSGRRPGRPPRLDSGVRHAKPWLSHMRALCERGSAWVM